jgi:type VI secretion system protein ImpJ
MTRLQPVIWSKGTFLTPQHLQIQDRFIENTLRFQLEALNFRPWGFQSLQIDNAALAAGVFSVSSATGIFPDGLLFDIPNSDAGPPPKPLADCFEVDQDSIDVYLAIPHFRDRGLNVSATQIGADTRYRAEVALLRDENSGQSEKPVQIARKNFRLLAQGEGREGVSALRIANVKRTPAGIFQADPYFVPPLVEYSASDCLISMLRRLIEILSAKSSQLAGSRRQKNQSLADFTASDIANFWLLHTINSNFPTLNHIFEAKRSHPERLFNAMLALAGALTTFSSDIHPRDLPRYDHDGLSFCFADLDEKLRLLLETVVPSNFVSLPLKLIQQSVYGTSISDDRYLKNTKMYLAVNAQMNQADLIVKTPQLVKVCSASHIEHLVRQALPGVVLTHVTAPPGSIPVKLNYQYFSLSQGGVAWEAIGRARNFAAYVPGDFPDPQLELIILLAGAG